MSEEGLRKPAGEVGERRRIVLDMPSWVPLEKVPRRLLFVLLAVALLAGVLVSVVPFAAGWISEEDFQDFGYVGIFLANFLGTATGFIPVPGLTAAGQGLIVWGSQELWVPAVVVVGATAMTTAESTAYLTGSIGRGLVEEREPVKGRIGDLISRFARWVDWLMKRWGFLTLLVLSAVPNPVFEFAGVTAGAVRMNFWRFIVAVGIGKTIRVILLVIIGDALIDAVEL